MKDESCARSGNHRNAKRRDYDRLGPSNDGVELVLSEYITTRFYIFPDIYFEFVRDPLPSVPLRTLRLERVSQPTG
jgi:hypothetical protein